MREQLVDALAHLREAVLGKKARLRPLVRRLPARAGIGRAEDACSRDADPEPFGIVAVERDRVRDQAACSGTPLLAGLVPEHRLVDLPGGARVVGAEEGGRLAAEPEGPRLRSVARLEMPGGGELEAALRRQAEALGALPGLAKIRGAVDSAAVDPAVRAGVEAAVARVEGGVVDRPAGQERALDLERAAFVVAPDEKEALARSYEQQHTHDPTLTKEHELAKLTDGQASFLHDEPHVAVVAALREDGTPHQTVVWVDWDGAHVLLNLNTARAKLDYMQRDPRVSLLVIDKDNPFRWLGIEGNVVETTPDGAYEHIVRQAGIYLGRESYELGPGEQRILVRIAAERVEAHNV